MGEGLSIAPIIGKACRAFFADRLRGQLSIERHDKISERARQYRQLKRSSETPYTRAIRGSRASGITRMTWSRRPQTVNDQPTAKPCETSER